MRSSLFCVYVLRSGAGRQGRLDRPSSASRRWYGGGVAVQPAGYHVSPMDTKTLTVSIPHQLGQAEALRRIKSGFGNARSNYSQFLTIDEETWTDNCLAFR